MKTKHFSKTVISVLILIGSSINGALSQDCNCTHTIEPDNLTDGDVLGFVPGDVICVKGGEYGSLFWKNINGTEENPIIIKNCGGQVVMSGKSYGWKWHTSKHFKIMGNGDINYEYGFVVSTASSFFMPMEYFTTNFEIAHVEVVGEDEKGGDIYAGFAGIGLKTSPYQDCDFFQKKGAWTMEDVTVRDCYIHQVGGEGIYAGHGFHQGREEGNCDEGVFTYPHAIHNLHIYNNRIENVGFDGIQVKNATQNALIHDNTIYNYGMRDEGAHNEGLFIGESTEGSFYNNRIEAGTGHGMQVNAYGNSKFYNNVVVDSGDNGVYLNNQNRGFENKEGDFEFYHNTFVNMGRDAFEIYTPQDVYLKNNIFVNYVEERHDGQTPNVEGDIYINDISSIGFVDVNEGNYYLSETSIALNAGVVIDAFNFDINNNQRNDGAPDVGAYEFAPLTLSLNYNRDVELNEGEDTIVGVQLIDEAGFAEKIQYILNGDVIATYTLPDVAEHEITADALEFGYNEVYAQALTFDGDIFATNPINITVLPAIEAEAGDDVKVYYREGLSVELNSASSTGSVNTATWNLIATEPAGIRSPTIDDKNALVTQLSNLLVGEYSYSLEVGFSDDGDLLVSDTDQIKVTVLEPPAILAEAGDDIEVYYEEDLSIELDGTHSQGEINNYTWNLIFRDPFDNSVPVIDDETASVINISGLEIGTYLYELEAASMDQEGNMISSDTDNVKITVKDPSDLILNTKKQQPINLHQVEVFDMMGVHLKTIDVNSEELRLNQRTLGKGLYIIRNVYRDGAREVKKILISEK